MSRVFDIGTRVIHVVGQRRGRIASIGNGRALVEWDSRPGLPSQVRLEDLKYEASPRG